MIQNLFTQFAAKILELRSAEPTGHIAKVLSRIPFGDKPLQDYEVNEIWNTPELRTMIKSEAEMPTDELAYKAFIRNFPYYNLLLNENNPARLEQIMLARGYEFKSNFIDNQAYLNPSVESEEVNVPPEQSFKTSRLQEAPSANDQEQTALSPAPQALSPAPQALSPAPQALSSAPQAPITSTRTEQSILNNHLDINFETITVGEQSIVAEVVKAQTLEQTHHDSESNISDQVETIRGNAQKLQQARYDQEQELARRQILTKTGQEEKQKQIVANQQQTQKRNKNFVKAAIAFTAGATMTAIGLPVTFSILFS